MQNIMSPHFKKHTGYVYFIDLIARLKLCTWLHLFVLMSWQRIFPVMWNLILLYLLNFVNAIWYSKEKACRSSLIHTLVNPELYSNSSSALELIRLLKR
jgi:hypothetical protein